jgi:hypothetical protein
MVKVKGIACPKFTYLEQDVVSGKIVSDTFSSNKKVLNAINQINSLAQEHYRS